MSSATSHEILDRLDVIFSVHARVQTTMFVAHADFIIRAGLYDGTPTAQTLIDLIASRGVMAEDLTDLPETVYAGSGRDETALNVLANEVDAMFQNPEMHRFISIEASIKEVLLDDVHTIAEAIA